MGCAGKVRGGVLQSRERPENFLIKIMHFDAFYIHVGKIMC